MSWMQSFQDERPDFERAMRAPIGTMSPLWWAFAGAATAGVAYWWLTRWAKPINIEAAGVMPLEMTAPPALEEAAAAYEMSPEAIEDVVDTPAIDEPIEDFTGLAHTAGDDLTQILGIGPKLALALADRGISNFAQIAAWTEDDLAHFDEALNLKGRAVRDGWVDQAKAMAEKTPFVLPD
jgi:predicted flap endonuclease-1-like 5' DNA nuclease